MNNLLRIHMPTRVYLKKYITFYEGPQPRVNNKTPFGRFVFAMLSKHTVIRDQYYAPTWLAREQNTEKLTLLVTHRTFTHVGDTVSMEKAAYINHYIKDQFDIALTLAGMNGRYVKGKSIKSALIDFAEHHGIEVEVDISIDNLLKIWHRKIQVLEPMSHQNIACPLISPYPVVKQGELFDLAEPLRKSFPDQPRKKKSPGFKSDPADEDQMYLF